jgi:hypothetical protein
MLQHATPEPIGYRPARVSGGSPITRPSKWARHIPVVKTPSTKKSRFNTDDLEIYERMMFGCLAWGDYSTYVITGEMGSGKTSVAQCVREVLLRERSELDHSLVMLRANVAFLAERFGSQAKACSSSG